MVSDDIPAVDGVVQKVGVGHEGKGKGNAGIPTTSHGRIGVVMDRSAGGGW